MCKPIHRCLMVRIPGFHPGDPGSIPGDEDCPGMTQKAPRNKMIGGDPLARKSKRGRT